MRKLFFLAAITSVALIGCKKEESKDAAKDTSSAKVTDKSKAPSTSSEVVSVTSTSKEAVAAFEDGRALQENFRFADAVAKYNRALELDPKFALAHAYLSNISSGEAREKHSAEAVKHATTVPENERLYINTMVGAAGDRITSLDQLSEKAPADWRVQMMIARHAQKKGDEDAARAAFEKAASLNPKAPYPHNNLAYIYAFNDEHDKAIAAVSKYAELSPGEPNPLDSKGEILLMAGKFAESEAAFAAAAKLSPSFAIAHEGIAATKFYRGDWDGGIAELELAVKNTARPIERFELQNKLGWAYIATNNDDKAQAAFAGARAAAKEAGITKAAGNELVVKAEILLKREDFAKAATVAGEAIAQLEKDGVKAKKQRWAQTLLAISTARGGKVDVAEKTLAQLTAGEADDHYVHYAKGHIELAKGNTEAALTALAKLDKDKWFANRASLLAAQVHAKAGNAEEAKKIREKLANTYRRDIYSVMIREEAKKAGNI